MRGWIVAALIFVMAAFAWLRMSVPPGSRTEQPSGQHSHAGDPNFLADGVVLSVDRSANNVTISHGPLQNLGMPAMTMGFRVGDGASLERLKPGDKVRFRADVIGGEFTVMKIEPAN